MRTGALATIALSEALIIALLKVNISASSLSMVSTLVVVVVVAFALSALLRNIQSMTLSKNYGISGLVGVISGIVYYIWAGEHLDAMVAWLQNYGVLFLLLIILIAAVILFVYKGHISSNDNNPSTESHYN